MPSGAERGHRAGLMAQGGQAAARARGSSAPSASVSWPDREGLRRRLGQRHALVDVRRARPAPVRVAQTVGPEPGPAQHGQVPAHAERLPHVAGQRADVGPAGAAHLDVDVQQLVGPRLARPAGGR